jgi:hypothetical protein
LFVGNSLSEGLEAPTSIDIINNECAVYCYDCPCLIQFETYIAFAVQAVVDEEINLAEVRKQLRKASSARTFDNTTSVLKNDPLLRHQPGCAKTYRPTEFNTPEMTVAILLKRLENAARSDAVSDAGLDNLLRPHVADQTPYRTHKCCIAIIPPLEVFRTGPNPFRFHFPYQLRP